MSAAKPSKGLGSYDRSHFNLYSKQTDISIGEAYMARQIEVFRKKGVGVDSPKNAALKKRIEAIVTRLAHVSDEPGFPYVVHIFDKPDIVNAFCLPGGKIGVFTGLFDPQKGLVDEKNDDQIAAVLGHEMAHATQRHVTRQMTTYQGVELLGTLASVGIERGVGANAQELFGRVFNLGANLYFPSYSRKHENEADQVGFYYMSKAGFNPQAAVAIWQKAAARGGPNSKQTDFFASHPADGVRAKTLAKWLPEAQAISLAAKNK
jgi:predicted Zn-dependent protease